MGRFPRIDPCFWFTFSVRMEFANCRFHANAKRKPGPNYGGVMKNWSSLFVTFMCFALTPTLSAQGLAYVKANYTKTEHQIPMRDGVRLYTAVYTPKDKRRT